jgi:DUF1680 family protein
MNPTIARWIFSGAALIFCCQLSAQEEQHLSFPYHDVVSWEKRKDSIRRCMDDILHINTIPKAEISKPLINSKRKYNGYTIENIALETTRGLFICGSIYRPAKITGKIPVILIPNGHFSGGRYRPDVQYMCASLARIGAMAVSYDMFGWGESRLQVKEEDHYTPAALIVQMLNTNRLLDYVFSLKETDTSRIGITGASGGGSQSMLNTALDSRIKLSVPIVMLSATFPGGCPCENGLPIRSCLGGINNAEIAAMAAPRPQLIISDGQDWTKTVPAKEFPYLQSVYAKYDQPLQVQNVHLPNEGHDLGFSKRKAVYPFIAKKFNLSLKAITNASGAIDESGASIEDENRMYAFGKKGELMPERALKNLQEVEIAIGISASVKSVFQSVPLQSIQPRGWLQEQLQIMTKGSSGHLDEIYDRLKDDNGWLGGQGDGGEETPYWLDGATPLAYLLQDKKLQYKILRYINWTLDHQRASGYFGPITPEEKKTGKEVTVENCKAGDDWWPKMIMLKTLQQYYSATNDPRVIPFMDKYFNYQLHAINTCAIDRWSGWSKARGVENIMMVNWLYNITHKDYLLQLAGVLQKQSFDWSKWFGERTPVMQAAAQQNDVKVMERHAVNVAMGLKEPVEDYLLTGEKKYLDIQKTAFNDLMMLHGLPMGAFSGDEDLHGNGLQQGSELCVVVETMYSLERMIDVTGDPQYMDALERLAFNALPAQTTDDYGMKQYFQLPNQVQIARGALAFTVTQENGMSNVLGTKSGYTCCYSNMHQGWTKYTAQLWHTQGNGIASLTYGPSDFQTSIGGNDIKIQEITDYPFNDKITFKISSANEVLFPWKLRVPAWCTKANIWLNGELLQSEDGGKIITINRKWKNNDELMLELPMQVTTSNWASNSRTVERGPLVYALKIGEEWKKDHHDIAGDYYSVYPTSAWNYGLIEKDVKESTRLKVNTHPLGKNFIWNQKNAPVEIIVPAKKIPEWTLTYGILYQPVCDRSGIFQGKTSDTTEQVVLIPYGCTKLRIVAFPVVK